MAIGAVADMLVQPYAALIIGSVAGALSVFGYEYITVGENKKERSRSPHLMTVRRLGFKTLLPCVANEIL